MSETISFILAGLSVSSGFTGVPTIMRCSPFGDTDGVIFEIKKIPFEV